jgi:hypothetical protein
MRDMTRTRKALLAAGLAAGAIVPIGSSGAQTLLPDPNPCKGADAAKLYCPDLRMRPPFDLHRDRSIKGHVVLRAANSIDNMGRGPAELRGRRIRRDRMAAKQAIHRVGGGVRLFDNGAQVVWKFIPGQYGYWKFEHAARFELWRVNSNNERTKLVREGPKVVYCLRDLFRTHPKLRRSPKRFVYPACNKNRSARTDTLGTSVGWSDVYPYRYFQQWIDITGLRGRFALVHIADPENGIWESNELNNEGETLISLPSAKVLGRRQPTSPEPQTATGYRR